MTAEVAVINKSAVALAADSAVTVEMQDPHDGRVTRKVYNTANKLFTLSKHHPVGIMVYNVMELGGVPWETIIKKFRKHIGTTSFPTLNEYAQEFFNYLTSNQELFAALEQEKVLLKILGRYFASLVNQINNNKKAKKILQQKINELEKLDYADGFSDLAVKNIVNYHKANIDLIINSLFKASHIRNLKTSYRHLAALALTKNKVLAGYSGVVIAGFGEKEVFPTVQEYHIDLVIDGKVRKIFNQKFTPEEFKASKVLSFAQGDLIRTVMEGINPDFAGQMLREAFEFFRGLPPEIIDNISELTPAQKEAYKNAARDSAISALDGFFKRMIQEAQNKHTYPIERAIEVMPFSELATVAEVFINLTQIRQRLSLDAETVGGPIDVAVISKGDGFVWIKRKFYFQKDLNYGFFQNYFE